MSWCPSCGSEVSEAWRFCRSCGTPLREQLEGAPSAESTQPLPAPAAGGDAVLAAPEVAPSPRKRRRWLKITSIVAAVLVLVAAASVGAWVHLEAREELRATRDQLRRTEGELVSTTEDLRTTRSQLEVARDENRRLERQLRELRVELRGVRGTLSEAQARLELQAGQIEDLKDCLNGVSLALDNVLYGDYWAAANALTAVQSSCEAAFALV